MNSILFIISIIFLSVLCKAIPFSKNEARANLIGFGVFMLLLTLVFWVILKQPEFVVLGALWYIILTIIIFLFSPSSRKYNESTFRLSTTSGDIYFGNPRDNFIVYAGANAGKTRSIGKPLLQQYIKEKWAGFIMDYKDFDYTQAAYHFTQKFNYPYNFYRINFVDLNTSHRVNIVKPGVVKNATILIQLMQDLLNSYITDGKRDEWYYGGLGVLKGVSYRFYTDYPKYCTIPHIISFIVHNDRKRITEFLERRPESKALASGFIDSADSEKTQSSILSSLTNYIGDLAFSKEIAYVLSGDDFDFNLIDPKEPKLLAVANAYAIDSIISPIIAMMATISSREFTLKNEVDFVYFFDEATTTKIRDFEKMPSVLREYRASFVLLTQSGAKIEKLYGKLDRSSIESNFANMFLGRTYDTEALKYYGMFFSKLETTRISQTEGHSGHGASSSTSKSKNKEVRYDADFFMGLKSGEFVGRAAHSNYTEFHLQFNEYKGEAEGALPVIRMVLPQDIERNYEQIIEKVKNID